MQHQPGPVQPVPASTADDLRRRLDDTQAMAREIRDMAEKINDALLGGGEEVKHGLATAEPAPPCGGLIGEALISVQGTGSLQDRTHEILRTIEIHLGL